MDFADQNINGVCGNVNIGLQKEENVPVGCKTPHSTDLTLLKSAATESNVIFFVKLFFNC